MRDQFSPKDRAPDEIITHPSLRCFSGSPHADYWGEEYILPKEETGCVHDTQKLKFNGCGHQCGRFGVRWLCGRARTTRGCGRRSAATAASGSRASSPRTGIHLGRRTLGLARSLGLGTGPPRRPSPCARSLGAGTLEFWPPRLGVGAGPLEIGATPAPLPCSMKIKLSVLPELGQYSE